MQRTRASERRASPTVRDSRLIDSAGWRDLPSQTPDSADDGIVEKAWRIVRRHPFVIVQAVLLVTTAAIVFSATSEKAYTATSTILFQNRSESILGNQGAITDPNREAATNEALLSLGVVAERTSRRLRGALSPAAVGEAVSILSTRQADLVDIQAETPDPELSARVANEYGLAFKDFRLESARAEIDATLSLVRAARAALTPSELAGERGESLGNRINQLEEARSLQTGGAELVQRASAPTEPSSPNLRRNGLLAALLGLILGFSLAALLERMDRGLKDVDDFEKAYGHPVLAQIPRSRTLVRQRLRVAPGADAEAFRMLRTSLRYVSSTDEIRSILVMSALPGEGKSTTARNLAVTMAEMGDRVVLVNADMHTGTDAIFGLEGAGLSDVLMGLDLDEVLVDQSLSEGDHARTLTVLPSGMRPENSSELLESVRMRDVIEELEARFDLVIIDTPPITVLSDALTLVGQVSGVVAVSAAGKTTGDAVRDFLRQIELLRGHLLGVVVNFATSNEKAAGSYYAQR